MPVQDTFEKLKAGKNRISRKAAETNERRKAKLSAGLSFEEVSKKAPPLAPEAAASV